MVAEEQAQVYFPLVLVKYNNSLYSCRENIRRCVMGGPIVGWDTVDLEPGFSISEIDGWGQKLWMCIRTHLIASYLLLKPNFD
jgi:hypothetical protein